MIQNAENTVRVMLRLDDAPEIVKTPEGKELKRRKPVTPGVVSMVDRVEELIGARTRQLGMGNETLAAAVAAAEAVEALAERVKFLEELIASPEKAK